MCSDHFSPWSERQGQSAFAWSWLGAALQTTSLPFGVVNAPGQRYHPAIIAQAAATLSAMYPRRLLGGAGHRRGVERAHHRRGLAAQGRPQRPAARVRRRHPRACTPGRRSATTASSPSTAPVCGRCPRCRRAHRRRRQRADRALGRRLGGRPCDVAAAARPPEADGRRLPQRRRPGPLVLQVHLSWAADDETALDIAHDQWRSNVFAPHVCWNLDPVDAFDEASKSRPRARRCRVGAGLVRPRPARRLAAGTHRARLRRGLPPPRRTGAARRASTSSASRSCRSSTCTPAPEAPTRGGAGVKITDTGDLWWKTAVVYCLDVETYLDSDGDGTGDLPGLAQRVDHLAELGVTCLWLMPFYPTPTATTATTSSTSTASTRGSAPSATSSRSSAPRRTAACASSPTSSSTTPSDQHPWFQSARASKDSPYRDFYVWRDEPPAEQQDVVFPDQEDSVWELDEKTGAVLPAPVLPAPARPQRHQPAGARRDREDHGLLARARPVGLPRRRRAVLPRDQRRRRRRTMRAAPTRTSTCATCARSSGRRSGDGILLGEVNLPHEEQQTFFGGTDGDELTMQFDFIAMQRLYLSLAREDAGPLAEALHGPADHRPDSQWATFVRNHDELTLDKLSDDERAGGVRRLRPRRGHAGLRPRPAPAPAADARRRPAPACAWSTACCSRCPARRCCSTARRSAWARTSTSRAGWPCARRCSGATGKNGGFSTAAPSRLPAPVVEGGFGPEHVNVAAQRRDPDSLLSFITLLVRRYRECPELGWGVFAVLDQPHRAGAAHTVHLGRRHSGRPAQPRPRAAHGAARARRLRAEHAPRRPAVRRHHRRRRRRAASRCRSRRTASAGCGWSRPGRAASASRPRWCASRRRSAGTRS